ncbi:hypothetical protein PR048_014501 [Dryococelus australis]|uniref:Uncharacterized protein n=1 Tax=Dryococelus australis TaxID=614101 RepID=A0ABQ9HEF3_9NEOP|nr:hypothetical protein PR048_014501 [Dryococelus australis]
MAGRAEHVVVTGGGRALPRYYLAAGPPPPGPPRRRPTSEARIPRRVDLSRHTEPARSCPSPTPPPPHLMQERVRMCSPVRRAAAQCGLSHGARQSCVGAAALSALPRLRQEDTLVEHQDGPAARAVSGIVESPPLMYDKKINLNNPTNVWLAGTQGDSVMVGASGQRDDTVASHCLLLCRGRRLHSHQLLGQVQGSVLSERLQGHSTQKTYDSLADLSGESQTFGNRINLIMTGLDQQINVPARRHYGNIAAGLRSAVQVWWGQTCVGGGHNTILAAVCLVRPQSRTRAKFGLAAASSARVCRSYSRQGEPGSIPSGVAPDISRVGIVPDDAAGRWVFTGICNPPPPPPGSLNSGTAPYSPRFTLPASQDRPNLTTHSANTAQQQPMEQQENNDQLKSDHSTAYSLYGFNVTRTFILLRFTTRHGGLGRGTSVTNREAGSFSRKYSMPPSVFLPPLLQCHLDSPTQYYSTISTAITRTIVPPSSPIHSTTVYRLHCAAQYRSTNSTALPRGYDVSVFRRTLAALVVSSPTHKSHTEGRVFLHFPIAINKGASTNTNLNVQDAAAGATAAYTANLDRIRQRNDVTGQQHVGTPRRSPISAWQPARQPASHRIGNLLQHAVANKKQGQSLEPRAASQGMGSPSPEQPPHFVCLFPPSQMRLASPDRRWRRLPWDDHHRLTLRLSAVISTTLLVHTHLNRSPRFPLALPDSLGGAIDVIVDGIAATSLRQPDPIILLTSVDRSSFLRCNTVPVYLLHPPTHSLSYRHTSIETEVVDDSSASKIVIETYSQGQTLIDVPCNHMFDAGIQGRGKRELPEKSHRPTASLARFSLRKSRNDLAGD